MTEEVKEEHQKPHVEHEKVEKVAEDRLTKIKIWLKNPYNALLVGILALAFALRLYFFIKTSGQTLWYDEADYMSTAKHWAFGTPYNLNIHRPPVFQFIGALGFMLGFNEMVIKFIIILLPSLALVYFVYLLGKEMYNEKVGLVAGFLTAVSWTLVFWTNRFQPDFFSMCFQVLAVLFMWKYWKSDKIKFAVLAGIFTSFGFLFKLSAVLVPMAFMVFIAVKDRLGGFKNKAYYFYSLAFLAPLAPYLIWSQMTFSTPFAFSVGYGISTQLGFGWYVIKFLYLLSENIIFALFVAGLIISLKFLLYADVLVKDKKKCMDPGLFNVITILVVLAWYIFWIRAAEDRWVFLLLPFIFILAGNAIDFIYNFGKKYSKIISVVVILALLAWGGWMQFTHEKSLIDNKKDSYLPVKEAALWMKDNSGKDDKIFSFSYPQTSYYSGRKVLTSIDMEGVNDSESFDDFLQREKPRYVEISIFETHPEWLYKWAEGKTNIQVVQVYFADEAQKQPSLIVYEVNYSEKNVPLNESALE
jgi:hypothetical protein